MPKDTILVPVDFEAASRKALDLAKDLAGRLGAEVAVVHCYTVPVYTYPGLEPFAMPALQTEVSNAARRALDELAASTGVSRTLLRGGDPATEILAVIDETKPKMVVMGTHGRRGFAHLLLGSVAERVVSRSPVPVLTVRDTGERAP